MAARTPSVFKINDLTKGYLPDADLEDFALLSVDRTEETNEGRIHIGLPDMAEEHHAREAGSNAKDQDHP
jgi:hypothetical protein